MRIRYARLILPSRMKETAVSDARQIAESVAAALSAHSEASAHAPAWLSIEIPGGGRPARHLGFDLTSAADRAVRVAARRT